MVAATDRAHVQGDYGCAEREWAVGSTGVRRDWLVRDVGSCASVF